MGGQSIYFLNTKFQFANDLSFITIHFKMMAIILVSNMERINIVYNLCIHNLQVYLLQILGSFLELIEFCNKILLNVNDTIVIYQDEGLHNSVKPINNYIYFCFLLFFLLCFHLFNFVMLFSLVQIFVLQSI